MSAKKALSGQQPPILKKKTEEMMNGGENQFCVCTAGGKQIPVPYRPELTISDVKSYVERLEGFPRSAQILIFQARRVHDTCRLSTIGVHALSRLYMLLVRPDIFQVFAKIDGKVRTLDVLPEDTVGNVKKLACRTIRANAEEYSVSLGNKGQLCEESRLSEIRVNRFELFEMTQVNRRR